MKKRKLWPVVLLAVCAILLGWVYTQVQAVGRDLQYLIPAPSLTADSGQSGTQPDTAPGAQPAPKALPNEAAKALFESLQTFAEGWQGILQHYTLSGIVESASLVSDADVTLQARLNALGPDTFLMTPRYLRSGRLFYPEELQNGADGILLDEQLALALFHVSEPIGRTVTIGDVPFTVIGVLRHTKKVGDSLDYAAYVPLTALWSEAIQLDALQVSARPVSGAGARSVFQQDMAAWQAGGTMIDLGKEGVGALLPLRVLLFFCGGLVFFRLLALWKNRLRRYLSDIREQLQREYAARLMPRLIVGALLSVLGLGALIAAAAVLIGYIVAPVYTFPEWVPAVPVEWNEISAAFWHVWQGAASLRELRSPELIRLRYFAIVAAWCSAGAAVSFTALWTRWQSRRQAAADQQK